ncbi:unnamed protein product [Adineta steineri]|uniref:Uncharacterized protein n=1 Tax=Adineta steineri TaxID=433720 RepID=A0A816A215_9BILA|nr:unnamed protein product [Adineta steineri]CAF1592305.1 unnamed protein product [Adineta steineri]
MINMKALLVGLVIVAIIERSNAAFQCYKCNNCGVTMNRNIATIALTEGGSNYCTKKVVGTAVTRDYSPTCTQGNGMYCCQDDLCNSSNSKYYVNGGLFILFSIVGFVLRQI